MSSGPRGTIHGDVAVSNDALPGVRSRLARFALVALVSGLLRELAPRAAPRSTRSATHSDCCEARSGSSGEPSLRSRKAADRSGARTARASPPEGRSSSRNALLLGRLVGPTDSGGQELLPLVRLRRFVVDQVPSMTNTTLGRARTPERAKMPTRAEALHLQALL